MSFISLLQDNAAQQPAGSMLMTVAPFILIIAIFYFFIIRPQNKKQKETENMLKALKKGDKVVTIGGIHGTVYAVKENTVMLKVEDGVKIEFNRSAIASVVVEKPASEKSEKKSEKAEAQTEPAAESKEESAAAESTESAASEENK